MKVRTIASCVAILPFVAAACAGENGSKNSGGPGGGGSGGERPDPIPSRFVPGDCNLDNPAFCETFEEVHPGGRGGDIDEEKWSFARWGHVTTELFNRATMHSEEPAITIREPATFCGEPFSNINVPDDVKICDGVDGGGHLSKQLNEVLKDYGGFAMNSFRIRQPFDFTDRTGTIVFDLDAKRNYGFDGHGWWTELWITADPEPIPYHGAPTVESYPRRGVGFQIAPATASCFAEDGGQEVGRVIITRDNQIHRDQEEGSACFKAFDGKLNRFKVLISRTKAEFYVTDADDPDSMRLVKSTDLDLDFSFGYIHFQHSQYNANKGGNATPTQTYRWDNIGFDGPAYPVPRGYDVPDSLRDVMQDGQVTGKTIGYYLDNPIEPKQFRVTGVDLTDATRATFNFDFSSKGGVRLRYRFNGNAWHDFTVPQVFGGEQFLHTFSREVPLSDLVPGDNLIEVELLDDESHPAIGNMDITIDTSR